MRHLVELFGVSFTGRERKLGIRNADTAAMLMLMLMLISSLMMLMLCGRVLLQAVLSERVSNRGKPAIITPSLVVKHA